MVAVNCTIIQLTDIFLKSHLWSQCCAGIYLSGEYVSHPSGTDFRYVSCFLLGDFKHYNGFLL